MKRRIGLLIGLIMVIFVCMGFTRDEKTKIIIIKDATSTDITLNNSYIESKVFDVRKDKGIYSLHYIFDTTATHANARIDFHLWVSPTGVSGTWCRSTDMYAIATDQHEGSGTDTNGIDCIKFEPTVNTFYKVRVTETATQVAQLEVWIIRR